MKKIVLQCLVCNKYFRESLYKAASFCSLPCKLSFDPKKVKEKKEKLIFIRSQALVRRMIRNYSLKPSRGKMKKKNQNRNHGKSGKSKVEKLREEIKSLKNQLGAKVNKTGFYYSDSWRRLRYRVIKLYGHRCGACGAVETLMHVDHIKPRSKYPELELDINNLQVLCEDCNMGKSNVDETDWRR